MVGDSGSGGTKGLVPGPNAGDAAANKFLKADGTWASTPASGGDADTVDGSHAADLVARGNHTGTQAASTISDFDTAADARIAAASVTDLTDVTNAGSGAIITSAERTKLGGIEAGATADQTGVEIKTAYEANADTNEFDDAEQTKLGGIETGADVTDGTNVAAAGAVMDSDFASGEGYMRKTGAGTYEAVKTNIGATTASPLPVPLRSTTRST